MWTKVKPYVERAAAVFATAFAASLIASGLGALSLSTAKAAALAGLLAVASYVQQLFGAKDIKALQAQIEQLKKG